MTRLANQLQNRSNRTSPVTSLANFAFHSGSWKAKGGKSPRSKSFKMSKKSKGVFMKEVVLLAGPNSSLPKQSRKEKLHQNGHVMAAMIFEKDWEEEEVMASFYSAFSFLPQTVKLEIMLPCGNSLVKPHISGGNMDGQIIHQIFCRKTIYLQPSKQLLEEDDTCTVEKETLDLPDLHPPKKRQDTCSKEQKTMDLPDLHPPKKRQDTCSKEQKTMDLPDLHPPKKHLK
ncbi:uncharacterized protein LOC134704812 [Mytilus trossulus]